MVFPASWTQAKYKPGRTENKCGTRRQKQEEVNTACLAPGVLRKGPEGRPTS